MGWLRRGYQRTEARALGELVELLLWRGPRLMGRIAAPFVARPRTSSSTIREEADALGYRMPQQSLAGSGTAPSTTRIQGVPLDELYGAPLSEHPEEVLDALAREAAQGDLPGHTSPEGQGSSGQADARIGIRSEEGWEGFVPWTEAQGRASRHGELRLSPEMQAAYWHQAQNAPRVLEQLASELSEQAELDGS